MKQIIQTVFYFLLIPSVVMLFSYKQGLESTAVNTDIPQVYQNNELQPTTVNNETLKFKHKSGQKHFCLKLR